MTASAPSPTLQAGHDGRPVTDLARILNPAIKFRAQNRLTDQGLAQSDFTTRMQDRQSGGTACAAWRPVQFARRYYNSVAANDLARSAIVKWRCELCEGYGVNIRVLRMASRMLLLRCRLVPRAAHGAGTLCASRTGLLARLRRGGRAGRERRPIVHALRCVGSIQRRLGCEAASGRG